MNFLEIAKRVRQECGISGDGPPAVTAQHGMYAKIVDWVLSAHEELQQLHSEWNFDWATTEQALTDGVEFYSPQSDWGLDFKKVSDGGLYVYRTADGPSVKTWLPIVDWAMMRELRTPSITGTPIYAAMAPDERLCFHPIPNDGLRAVLEYYRTPQIMTANNDTPRIPARFHMAIVWRAVMFWCAHDENPALWQSASQNYRSLVQKMTITELPGIEEPEPLA